MNKSELAKAVAAKTGLTQIGASDAVNAVLSEISDALARKDEVQLIGFGTFKVSQRAARTGRNPATGKEIKIEASLSPVFKAGAALKTAVNGK